MAAKRGLDGMPREIADRAKAVFGGVVNDLDRLFKKLGDRIGHGSASQRTELLKLVRALRKSLDTRLGALERLIAGTGANTGKRSPPAKKSSARKAAPQKATARRRR